MREDWPRAYTVEYALPDDTRVVDIVPFADLDGVLGVWLESDQWDGDADLREPRVTVHLLDPVKMAQSLRDDPPELRAQVAQCFCSQEQCENNALPAR